MRVALVAQIIRCQPARLAIASLDSAVYQRFVDDRGLDRVFCGVPKQFRWLRDRIDGRCMSGLESIVRVMVEDAGLRVVPQVFFERVGVVDLLVEDCVIIETDGRANHDDVIFQRRDYHRDAVLTARNYTVLRFSYQQVMFELDEVRASVYGALRAHRAARHLG
jgi:very-short-patch-repair endonuclease